MLNSPSVQSVLNDNASASVAFDKAVEKYSQVIDRLGQEFENRFCDLDQLESCVSFISNPFMQVDMTCIAEQLSAMFNLNAGQVEIEIVKLQNDLHLKSHHIPHPPPPPPLQWGVVSDQCKLSTQQVIS